MTTVKTPLANANHMVKLKIRCEEIDSTPKWEELLSHLAKGGDTGMGEEFRPVLPYVTSGKTFWRRGQLS